jgi:ubiquitin carboxyl-terminal hydrolase 25/28
MDTKDAPKPRRPLPQQPVHSSVRPASDPHFYSQQSSSLAPSLSSSSPPPLAPTRPKSHGSSLTTYHPPPSPPPSYVRADNSPFREPELITEEPITVQGSMPELIPHSTWHPDSAYENHPDWANAGPTWGDPTMEAWQPNLSSEWPSDSFDPTTYMAHHNYVVKMVEIDARDYNEELNWWNADIRATHRRPGPGILPPVLTDSLHNSEHALLSVLVLPPDIKPRPDPTTSISSSASQQQANPQTVPPLIPPSEDDVRTAVPHPHSYYCRRHNGWVILAWKSSSMLPPLSKSFLKNNPNPLPDPIRRRKVISCIGDGEQPFGQLNKTHHFHVYEKAVDSHQLSPPFRRAAWEKAGRMKEKRRAMTISAEETDFERLQKMEDDVLPTEETEGDLLDLYVCCQCSLHCVASAVVAGVIHIKYVEELVRDKLSNPLPGKSGPVGVVTAWETLLRSDTFCVSLVFLIRVPTGSSKTSYGGGRTAPSPSIALRSNKSLVGIPSCESNFGLGYILFSILTYIKRENI